VSFLLDTNIVSELRRPRPHAGVMSWFDDQSAHALFLSIVTVGEIKQGVEQLRTRDRKQAEHLDRWLNGLSQFYEDRLLYVDGSVADEWGRLRARRSVPVMDAFIAATARVHGLTLVTRNVRDFAGLEVELLNPFASG
jgi:predicted nucleic acid-binding protein